MRLTIGTVLLAALLMLGAAPATAAGNNERAIPAEASNDAEFMAWMSVLTEHVSQDRHYMRIPLDTDRQTAEFTAVLHTLYRGGMTDIQFMEWVGARYPGHEYEQATILKSLHDYRKSLGR